jgi:hypothetical protein
VAGHPELSKKQFEDLTIKEEYFLRILLILIAPVFSGCWYAAAAEAGAYVGYKAKEEGYTTQSPKTPQKQEEKAKN